MRYISLNLTLLLAVGLVTTSTSDDEETNPFLDAAKALLHDSLQNDRKDSGIAGGIGSLVQHFMQSEGGRQIGDVLQQSGGSDLLAGLGSLLTGRQQGGSGLDPQLVGKVVEMFTGSQDKSEQGGAMEGLINLLPLLANTGHMHHDDPELENEEEHRRHQQATSMFPPFLNSLWNHFITSELGQTLWANSGLAATMQLFQDREGNFQMDRIFQSLENNAFRRRWVRSLTGFVAEWIKHMADPATLKRYMSTAQFVGNGFLKAQGYSKAVLFDPSRPAESLSLMVNAVFKRNFGLKINSATYIKPAVSYIQEVLQLSQSKGLSLSYLSSKDIENKLSETVNNEIIEPILRVWRAYKYAIKVPQCDRYLICTLNQHEPTRDNSAGFKPGVTKLASLISSWFLSGNTGTPFWKLYNAAVDDHNCQIKYPVDCSQFHEEDIKATTEYLHNEL